MLMFLSIMVSKSFNPLHSLVQPDKTYDVFVVTLERHFVLKLLIIAKCFHFHKRNQKKVGFKLCMVAVKIMTKDCIYLLLLKNDQGIGYHHYWKGNPHGWKRTLVQQCLLCQTLSTKTCNIFL